MHIMGNINTFPYWIFIEFTETACPSRGKFPKDNNSLKATNVLEVRQRVYEVKIYCANLT